MFNTMIGTLSAKRLIGASVGRVWLMRKASILTLAAGVAIGAAGNASAAILYSTAAPVYSENFDSLPANSNPFTGALLRTNGGGRILSKRMKIEGSCGGLVIAVS